MAFARDYIACSSSCTSYVGTGRYIVRSIQISIMFRRSHVIIIANLSKADDGHEDMTMGRKGIGLLCNSQLTSLLSCTGSTLQQWNGVMCRTKYAFSSLTLTFLVYSVLLHGLVGCILHFFRYMPKQI